MPCLGETGSVLEKKDVQWKITDFFSLTSNVGDYYESPTFSFAGQKWCLRIYPGGDLKENSDCISLHLRKKLTKPDCSIQYTIDIMKADGSLIVKNKELSHFFTADQADGYPRFCSFFTLSHLRLDGVLSDGLTLACTMRQDGDSQKATSPASDMELSELETLSENFRGLLSHKQSCDVTLVVRGKPFRVHKAMLIARSSVFSAMFEHEMSENQTGSVDIPDCDEESFQTFIEYLYTGKAKGISFDWALHLYRTSHKYDVKELKALCLKILDGNLTVDGVIDAVLLADEYDEDDLMSTAQNFFNSNFGEIILTKHWETLNRKNFRLANRLNIGMSKYVSTLKQPPVVAKIDKK